MPQLTGRPRRATGPRRGLSLIELLISMSVLAIIGTAVLKILTQQQRFYRDASERVELRRELRGGAAIVPADLRALSTIGDDILSGSATELEIRASIGSAVVCAKPTNLTLHLVPLNTSNHTLTTWYTPPEQDDAIFIFNDSSSTGADDDKWSPHTINAALDAGSAARCAGSPFVPAADAALPKLELTVTPQLSPYIAAGSVVRITRRMRYRFYQPAGASDWYVGYQEYRAGAYRPIQPVIGPLVATSGLSFTYFDSAGTAVNMSTAAERRRVTRIGLRMLAAGRSDALRQRGGQAYRDSLVFKIGVRNFK